MYYCTYLEIFLSLNICRNFEFCQNFIDENFSPRDDEGKKIVLIFIFFFLHYSPDGSLNLLKRYIANKTVV